MADLDPIFDRAKAFLSQWSNIVDTEHRDALADMLVAFACQERMRVIQDANAAFVNAMHRRANRDGGITAPDYARHVHGKPPRTK